MTVRFPPGRHLGQSQAETPGVSGYQTPAELREQRDMMAVALKQPHRCGSVDPRCESVLWGECQRLGLRQELYEAGEQYHEISLDYKLTIGVQVPGGGPMGDGMAEDQKEARARLAKDRYWKVINVLRRAHPTAQGVVERVCYDNRAPAYYEDPTLRKGLYSLAVHFGTLKFGINDGKPIYSLTFKKIVCGI